MDGWVGSEAGGPSETVGSRVRGVCGRVGRAVVEGGGVNVGGGAEERGLQHGVSEDILARWCGSGGERDRHWAGRNR